MQAELEREYIRKQLSTTGNSYTFDSINYIEHSKGFQPVKYEEYEYKGKKYIRIKSNTYYDYGLFKLSKWRKLQKR